jgi:putative transcriptional regulator
MNRRRARRLADALAQISRSTDATRPNFAHRVDVAALRRRLGMTQTQFARRFGFPVATLRHWELGDRNPRGPARVLLTVIARNHRAVLKALSPDPAKEVEVTGLYT